MSNPRLLMLDEPSWGIAPKLVDRIFDVVREIRANGVTILLVEQDVEDALEISDRAYVIQTGRVALEGKSAEVLSSDLIQKFFFGL
jgi:branched-chain amino acid transport system ATP-binding protein